MKLGLVKHGILSVKKRIYWETQLLSRIRDWKDGITFFEFRVNCDKFESDHTPSFQIELTILNLYNHLWIYQNNYNEEEYE